MKKSKTLLATVLILLLAFIQLNPVFAAKKTSPKKPVLTVTSTTPTSIQISWKKISNATNYQIYRFSNDTGEYQKIASTKKLTYNDTKLSPDKTYYYKVRAMNKSSKTSFSNVLKVTTESNLSIRFNTKGVSFIDIYLYSILLFLY